ncbi:hypothetical protein ACQV2X_06795 [Facklamia sp. P12945]|uniref:hypothetical protein n=1 Tax=unclassified Facklamia TaxID=2622293 RepID=UPI003D1821FA
MKFNIDRLKQTLEEYSRLLEMVIVIAITLSVAVGMIDLFKYGYLVLQADVIETYSVFQNFLGYALLLLVGIELIFMLLFHSPKAVLELILFVIARKMLIYAQTMEDLVLGSIAIFIVFATVHFLVKNEDGHLLRNDEE